MDASRSALYPNVPTLKEATGSDWTMAAWRGIAAPKGMPADVREKLVAALKKVYDSKEYTDFMAQPRLRRDLCGARTSREVHGEVGRRSRRDDEGRGHRRSDALDASSERSRIRARRMKLNDRLGALLVAALVLCTIQGFPAIPGRRSARRCSRADRRRAAVCGVLLVVRGAARRAGAAASRCGWIDCACAAAWPASCSRDRLGVDCSTSSLVDTAGLPSRPRRSPARAVRWCCGVPPWRARCRSRSSRRS